MKITEMDFQVHLKGPEKEVKKKFKDIEKVVNRPFSKKALAWRAEQKKKMEKDLMNI